VVDAAGGRARLPGRAAGTTRAGCRTTPRSTRWCRPPEGGAGRHRGCRRRRNRGRGRRCGGTDWPGGCCRCTTSASLWRQPNPPGPGRPLTCPGLAAEPGMEVVPAEGSATVEGAAPGRPKAKHLVARDRRRDGSRLPAVRPGQAAGHDRGHRPVDHRPGAGRAVLAAARQGGLVRLLADSGSTVCPRRGGGRRTRRRDAEPTPCTPWKTNVELDLKQRRRSASTMPLSPAVCQGSSRRERIAAEALVASETCPLTCGWK
jgi:hypothetical protein